MQTSCSLIHAVLWGLSSNTNRTIPTAAEEMSGAATAANEIKYRGVRKRKWGKYVAEIRLPNSRERIWLGSYDAAEKAARAFDAALFCLRGRAANFNFSDDPPEIEGGESLPTHEIQAVAQRYGNSYGRGRHDQAAAADGGDGARTVQEDAAGFDGMGSVDLIDRSFWEMIDVNGGRGGAAECNVDYGDYFLEVNEMLVDYEARVYEDEECFDHILWTF